MKELGITKGGCIIDYDAEHCNYGTVDKSMAYPIICHDPEEGSFHVAAVWKDAIGDCEQNAKLIVDAFNTSNKTGLFPSELLRQRNEMIKQLAYIQECCEVNAEDSKGIDKKVYLELADIAEKAINNTKGE